MVGKSKAGLPAERLADRLHEEAQELPKETPEASGEGFI
jgi:hypothetical protein